MPNARMHIVDAHQPGAFHITSRCVRLAWLSERDPLTGRDLSHRKRWIEERIATLAKAFSVAVYAYAVMANHVHLVVRTDPQAPQQWDAADVLQRWFSVSRRNEPDEARQLRIETSMGNEELIAKYRMRLGNLSWFMRFLNESIARAANAEDGCTGRFWEGRFHSKALLDVNAVLSGMAYVDLNPVRAGIVETPEAAKHVSIRRRFDAIRNGAPGTLLLPVFGTGPELAVSELEYLTLVDETGRRVRPDKPGAIGRSLPAIVSRLGMSERAWLKQVQGTESCYWRVIGRFESFVEKTAQLGQRWLKGCRLAAKLRST